MISVKMNRSCSRSALLLPSMTVVCLDPSPRLRRGVRWDTCGGSGPRLAGFANFANFDINGANAWEAEIITGSALGVSCSYCWGFDRSSLVHSEVVASDEPFIRGDAISIHPSGVHRVGGFYLSTTDRSGALVIQQFVDFVLEFRGWW